MTRRIRTYAETADPVGSDLVAQINAQADRLTARMAAIRNTIVVASGKGGVGKSFMAAAIAAGLARRGCRIGALDADVNGPSLARLLGASRTRLRVDPDGVHPASSPAGCTVMSTDLLIESRNAPLRWREPASGAFVWQSALETGMLREFLSDVSWGDLDALVIDLPPGTDKIARILPLLPRISAMLLVTTPSAVTGDAVARSLTQLRDAGVPDIGIIQNMNGYVCPECRAISPLFTPVLTQPNTSSDAPPAAEYAETPSLAGETWAFIPFDPRAAAAADAGGALPDDSPVTAAVDRLIDRLSTTLSLKTEAIP